MQEGLAGTSLTAGLAGKVIPLLPLPCKTALKALPQLPYACEMTRENKGICYSAGPQAERAYQAFLVEYAMH